MSEFIVPITAPQAMDAGRFGPKAANLALLGNAGLPIPEGYCLGADGYRRQLDFLGLHESARGVFGAEDSAKARRYALDMKLGLMDQPICPEILEPLLAARRDLIERTNALMVVRSSALVEDRYGSSFAGQFESYVGLETEEDFITAVRACWAALWSARALRYMATHGGDPAAHRHGRAGAAAGIGNRLGRWSQPDSGRRDVAVGDVGVGLIDRAR